MASCSRTGAVPTRNLAECSTVLAVGGTEHSDLRTPQSQFDLKQRSQRACCCSQITHGVHTEQSSSTKQRNGATRPAHTQSLRVVGFDVRGVIIFATSLSTCPCFLWASRVPLFFFSLRPPLVYFHHTHTKARRGVGGDADLWG